MKCILTNPLNFNLDQNSSSWGFDFDFYEKELAFIANGTCITKFEKCIYMCINKAHFSCRLKLEISSMFTHQILFKYDNISGMEVFLLLSISSLIEINIFYRGFLRQTLKYMVQYKMNRHLFYVDLS